MKYAVISLCGRQFTVHEGDTINVEGNSVLDPVVLMYSTGTALEVGTPYLADINVGLEILRDYRGDKVEVRRFRSKSRYRKNKGHKQPMTTLLIKSINGTSEKPVETEKHEKKEKSAKPAPKLSKVNTEVKPKKVRKVTKKEE